MRIRGAVLVVTGGGNGIGREVVLALLARGARVAALDLSADGLAGTVQLAPDAADRLTTHALDVTDRAAVAAVRGDVLAAHGHVDGLINVAGIIQRFARVADLEYAEIEKVMAVNFWGVVATTKTFLPDLLSRPVASLVNVSSMGALAPVPGQSAYGASKAAVKLFTEGLYAELRGTKVAVTVVFPGGVGTDIAQHSGVTIPGMESRSAAASKLTSPAEAGRQIVEAVEKGTFRVRIGGDARMLDRLSRLLPTRAAGIVADRMKALLDG
ncbi:SDR family NAD(P)-dependent oxidoreductase [Cellulomonas soli]|uniref:Short-chain dehydrogenase n=1 Tax=Cellulomonas soli TaxID=931535 RepID=A0A512P8H8_9CELL|nr:SDR family oxidoreductase [Cellulomonas soli]NYI57709.1 NAD(P)-dependent dehydrogenase (short-subunit alcohol dehydrogenase family) [Cellulomonas soli]GEP67490.1 short-chain dehydrogenase [Cellulomonas soli]